METALERVTRQCKAAQAACEAGELDGLKDLLVQQMVTHLKSGRATPRETLQMGRMVARLERKPFRLL